MIIKVCQARQSTLVGAGPGGLPPRRKSDSNLGRSMGGLVRYLLGPGTSDEHTDQRVVAGSEPLEFEYGGEDLTGEWARGDVAHLVKDLNVPMQDKRAAGELGEDRGFVFHAVLSMPPGERNDDELWNQVTHDYIDQMGFDSQRWIAVHHGLSKEGNDHVHVAVMMIKDDGTWADNFRSKQRSMDARRFIDAKYGFARAEDIAARRGHTPYSMADAHRDTPQTSKPAARTTHVIGADGSSHVRRSAADNANDQLRRAMTAAASEATSEADYVKALWRAGVLTRPRYAQGTTDVVVGYSVALRDHDGTGRSQWRGAGTVHRSLTLTRLRERWEDTPQSASEAAATWNAFQGESPIPARALSAHPHAAAGAAAELSRINTELAALHHADPRWARISTDAAGLVDRLSARYETARQGPLHEAAEALLRDGQLRREMLPAIPAESLHPTRMPAYSGIARAARLLAQAHSDHDLLAWAAVVEQLARMVAAIRQAREAAADHAEAAYLLARTHDALQPSIVGARPSAAPDETTVGERSTATQVLNRPTSQRPAPGRVDPTFPPRERGRD